MVFDKTDPGMEDVVVYMERTAGASEDPSAIHALRAGALALRRARHVAENEKARADYGWRNVRLVEAARVRLLNEHDMRKAGCKTWITPQLLDRLIAGVWSV